MTVGLIACGEQDWMDVLKNKKSSEGGGTERGGAAMKIVILSPDDDNHTAPIRWALEKAGYTVVCWTGLAWTLPEQASLHFREQTKVALGPHFIEPGDVVWVRRPEYPVPNPSVSEADRKFAETEY